MSFNSEIDIWERMVLYKKNEDIQYWQLDSDEEQAKKNRRKRHEIKIWISRLKWDEINPL